MSSPKVSYWLDLAYYDLETARVMLDGRRYLYVGFMCQQVVEKALKAGICSISDEFPPYTHNLLNLAERSGFLEKFNDAQAELLSKLNPLNIEARYPSTKDVLAKSLDLKTCRAMIDETKELLQWIKQQL